MVIKSVGHRVHRVSAISLFRCDPFKKDRTSSFRKSTLKSTRGDPLRSRIFPWVISPVGRYLMHFYRFIYSSSTFERAFPLLPRHHTAAVTTRHPLSPLSPCLLFHFPLNPPLPLFLRTYPPTLPSLSCPPIRLFLLFSSARFNFSFGSLLLR